MAKPRTGSPKSDCLCVNLSASQTRKRLKGHGFGVRRVEAMDRHQAVIYHTATGQHLRDLKSLFRDVLTSPSPSALSTPLENLRNLGPASAQWLREIGVHNRADLERLGPVVAFQLVKQRQVGISWNLLWALVGALRDEDWRELTDDEKQQLQRQIEES